MMLRKKMIKRIAGTLVAIMILSSFNVFLDVHLCQGTVKNIAFFTEAKGCSDMTSSSCTAHNSKSNGFGDDLTRKQCCTNQHFYNEVGPNLITATQPSFNVTSSLPAICLSNSQSYFCEATAKTSWIDYLEPPPHEVPIRIQLNTFLI
ncbi:MAG: hypothetical protein ACI8ZN_001169 [Bacteroidia bacterium]|jgi:hypothetical protein